MAYLVWWSPKNSVAQIRAAAIETQSAPKAVVAVAAMGLEGICNITMNHAQTAHHIKRLAGSA